MARMPHRGAMRLIDQIVSAKTDRILCIARAHDAPDYPLRLGGVLHCATLVELGAQAAAAHASLFDVGAAHMGVILSLSNVTIHRDVIDTANHIQVTADRLHTLNAASTYGFEVAAAGEILVMGEVLLSIREMPL